MRRAVRAAVVIAAVLAVAAAGLWLARVPIAERLLAFQLQRYGYPEADFRVTRLDWRGAAVRSVAARPGDQDGLRIERIEAAYRPLALLRGHYRQIRIVVAGVRGRLARTGTDAANGGDGAQERAVGGTGGRLAAGALRAESLLGNLPNIRLRDVRIDVALPGGAWNVEAEGSVAGEGTARADLTAAISDPDRGIQGRVDAQYADRLLIAEARLRDGNDGALRLDGELSFGQRQPVLALDWNLAAPAGAELSRMLLPGPAPTSGALHLEGKARGRLPHTAVPGSAAGLVQGLSAGGWRADFTIDGRSLGMDGAFRALSVRAVGAVRARDGALVLRSASPGRARVERLDEAVRHRLAGYGVSAGWLDGPFELTWPSGELARLTAGDEPGRLEAPLKPRLTLNAPGDGGRGEPADGRSGGAAFDRLAVELPLRVETGDGRWQLRAADGGSVRIDGAVLPGGWRATQGIRAAITEGELVIGESWGGSGTLAVERTRLEPPADGGGPEAVTIGGGRLTVTGPDPGAVTVRGATLGLPAQNLTASGLRVDWHPDGAGCGLAFDLDRLAHEASPSWLAPVTLSGCVERDDGGLRMTGRGRAADNRLVLRLEGRAGPELGSGTVSLLVPELRLQPEGLQPGQVAPALEAVEALSGRARGELELTWDDSGPSGRAAVAVHGLDLEYGRVSLSGATGELELADLLAPRTDRPQRLEAEALTALATLGEPSVALGVAPAAGGGSTIAVSRASGQLWGGRIALRDESFTPGKPPHELAVQVEGVLLGRLLAKLSVDGLDGRGRLSGRIPVVLGEAGVAVRDGRLTSENGVIRYRSEKAERALGDTHKAIRLLVRALRDFHYDSLEIRVTREPGTGSRLRIAVAGHNPAVLDNHPFRLNISVTGDVEPLVKAVARGRELTDELLGRHLDLELR